MSTAEAGSTTSAAPPSRRAASIPAPTHGERQRAERDVSESFDVIVVGARCAGAPLATMLAHAGLRVCVVDKDGFPSDTLSTHAIQPAGVQVLERIGVLDALLEVAPPMLRGRMVFDEEAVVIDDVVAMMGAPVLSVRRITLDEMLVNAAADAGAQVRTRTAVTG